MNLQVQRVQKFRLRLITKSPRRKNFTTDCTDDTEGARRKAQSARRLPLCALSPVVM